MLRVVADLGVADRIPADGAVAVADLAAAGSVHPTPLLRILRALAAVGVFRVSAEGLVAHSPRSRLLRTDAPLSLHHAARFWTLPGSWRAWEKLDAALTGGSPHQAAWGLGRFDYLRGHPDEARTFDAFMASFPDDRHAAVAAAYDFSRIRRIVDVGGGNGVLLAGILTANPTLTGVIFDLPHVAARAEEQIRELGLEDRCEIAGGDFFKEVPGGGDAYLLKHVIHDWNDDRAIDILRSCRRAMGAEARLLIIEGVYPPRIDQSDESRGAAANDVNMLVCTGGRQRSEAEFRGLYEAAGFRLMRIVPTQAPVKVIEGVCA
ncbi:MAG TPA: methyltransferase, partial [Microvirga sp.]|nr:methyltransferase [Microvirga sp.]